MALYENGKRISGIRDFPAYTWDEYHALPVAQRPKVWKCTDRDYTDVLTAGGVSYDNTLSGLSSTDVQGAVDEVAPVVIHGTTASGYATWNDLSSYDLTNRWLVGVYIEADSGTYYFVSQSDEIGSVAMSASTHRPELYVPSSKTFWIGKPCIAVYY